MKIGIPRETVAGERRVALTPEAAALLVRSKLEVLVEKGAGSGAWFTDADYETAGAQVVPDVFGEADIVAKLHRPTAQELDRMREGSVLICFLYAASQPELVERLVARRITALAMDAIPRISRAQSMDALSSQASVAGYKAAILAAEALPKFFPMLTTAAGTIRPAQVLVLGAGVAGLQAIATARRLGAMVWGYDIRAAVKEQVESLGAKFLELDIGVKDAEGAGGYAKELSEEAKRQQQKALAARLKDFDVVITTAQVPGRPAPRLIPKEAVTRMRRGSVIVDLAAETGGNCELTRPGQTVVEHGVTIIGPVHLAATMPVHASQLYARNVTELIKLLVKDGQLRLDFNDEIVKGACVTHDGKVMAK
ncbi:MAG: Re/Si-specific NAD(P)(+) transhydrogenase subunit alpha [Verrucomicrobiae bacterium]|nr:Re/Si-specific NAD(P)(+) transhydrogenase subunit alpha [Verrucomicrobiae bacterium]